jgi:hypothetical protein
MVKINVTARREALLPTHLTVGFSYIVFALLGIYNVRVTSKNASRADWPREEAGDGRAI